MDKNQKIVLFSGIGLVAVLIIILLWILLKPANDESAPDPASKQAQLAAIQLENDSLRMAYDMMRVDQLSHSLDSLPDQARMRTMNLDPEQTELLNKYNEARNKIQVLLSELKAEQANSAKDRNRSAEQMKAYQQKISELEGQISQLKSYCKDLLARLQDLTEKYEEQVQINTRLTEEKRALEQTVTTTQSKNEELTTKVTQAQRLVLTNISLNAYNKKDKAEKNVTKAKKLGVAFTVTANNAAAPGIKDFYITIKTPEGQQLTGGGAFQAEGTILQATAKRQIEYANDEVSTAVYWDVNTSLTPGEYTVRIFCNGECLATRKATLK